MAATARRRTVDGSFRLPMRATRAIGWFTPEGERAWVPGWHPSHPGGRSERAGTVFTTEHDGTPTTWTVLHLDRVAAEARYSRVTPARHAGTVAVRCTDDGPGCVVTVAYDLTALHGAPADILSPYRRAAFDAMLEQWRRAVTSAA